MHKKDGSILNNLRNDLISKLDLRLVIILVIYVLLGLLLLGYYQYQINPDGVGYIDTAYGYLSGNFYESVNAYWGPLLSWLLMFFLYFNQTASYSLFSAKILALIFGFFTIIGVRQLSYRFEMDELIRSVILMITVPIILYFALSVITPDLLIVCILVYYLTIIFHPNYTNNLYYGILCGLLGAFGYMGKSFIFPFFLIHFSLFNIFHYLESMDQKQKKIVVKNLLLGLCAFLIVSGVWMGIISSKEGKFTFGTSGEYNHALMGPNSNVPDIQGLSKPGEIDVHSEFNSWSPFESWNNLKHQVKIFWNNFIQTLAIYQYYSYLSIFILLSYLLLSIRPFKELILCKGVLYPLITVIIFSGGYLPILVEERYLWFVYILLLLMGGYLLNILFKTDLFDKKNYNSIRKTFLLSIFVLSFVLMPVNSLISNLNTGKDVYTLSNTLKNDYGVQGIIATNDNLIYTQYLSFYLKTTSYGQTNQAISSDELQSQLQKYKIDYYFVWGDSAPLSLAGYREITGGKIKDLKIYRRDK